MTYHYVFQHDNIHNNLLFSQRLRSSLLTSFSIAVDISSASPVSDFSTTGALMSFRFRHCKTRGVAQRQHSLMAVYCLREGRILPYELPDWLE